MTPLKIARSGLRATLKEVNRLCGLSLIAEAQLWQLLLKRLPKGKLQVWMIAHSLRTTTRGMKRLRKSMSGKAPATAGSPDGKRD